MPAHNSYQLNTISNLLKVALNPVEFMLEIQSHLSQMDKTILLCFLFVKNLDEESQSTFSFAATSNNTQKIKLMGKQGPIRILLQEFRPCLI